MSPLDPAASPGFLLWRTTLAWQRRVTAALAPHKLTHVQFVLLACAWWMNEQGEQPRQGELAAQAGTDVKMTSEVLRHMESRGLLNRLPDPDDSRARRIAVTAAGARLAPQAIAVVEAADGKFFRPVPKRQAIEFLGRLADAD